MRKMMILMMVCGAAWNAWAGTGFALDLYGELKGEEVENLFFSPASIATALGMTFQGGTPTVVMGDKHTISHATNEPVMAIPFTAEAGSFVIEFCFE